MPRAIRIVIVPAVLALALAGALFGAVASGSSGATHRADPPPVYMHT